MSLALRRRQGRLSIEAAAGLPVAVVPCGSEDNLPIGVQIAARPYQEHIALAAAMKLESTGRIRAGAD